MRGAQISGRGARVVGRGISYGSAIPYEENLHAYYDLKSQIESDGSVIDPLVDQSENGRNATAVGSPTMDVDGLNGHQTAILDGVEDGWTVSAADWGTLSQPFTVYQLVALDASDLTQNYHLWEKAGGSGPFAGWSTDTYGWRVYAGTAIDGTTDETINLLTGVYDGANSSIHELETQTNTGDPGAGNLDGEVLIGRRSSTEFWWDGRLSALMFYSGAHDATTRSEIWDYLISRF